ncbi:structural protein P5 [Pseudomonas sp. PONIH3]|jgi:hypothetical protein|uniref:structural protein P5 n=1 Tax=Pseudomonas sp. PONIH3 TaxID=1636610 RepID=UPI000CDCAAAA|nr:structural protein P5 [Pseudomonas sp. PONIH3]AUY32619.1 structural protein P5 [Pseudomonas sp. PONIH3]
MSPSTARGVRNNNPGNIDCNSRNAWQGQFGVEVSVAKPRFARFASPENAIRALGKLLINYRGGDSMPGVDGKDIDTVVETINCWAPSNGTDTQAYAAAVAKRLGARVTDPIDIKNLSKLFVESIIIHENGESPYKGAVINEDVRRALE